MHAHRIVVFAVTTTVLISGCSSSTPVAEEISKPSASTSTSETVLPSDEKGTLIALLDRYTRQALSEGYTEIADWQTIDPKTLDMGWSAPEILVYDPKRPRGQQLAIKSEMTGKSYKPNRDFSTVPAEAKYTGWLPRLNKIVREGKFTYKFSDGSVNGRPNNYFTIKAPDNSAFVFEYDRATGDLQSSTWTQSTGGTLRIRIELAVTTVGRSIF